MRFIMVNDRVPMDESIRCSCCVLPFKAGYIREIGTNLLYCDMVCFKFSEKVAIAAIEDHARHVS